MTAERIFIDTNICLYALHTDPGRFSQALTLLSQRPFISIQIINECGSVLARKLGKTLEERITFTSFLEKHCRILPLTIDDVHVSQRLQQVFKLSHWDSLAVASALNADCSIFYSEDMSNGQQIESLTILNPYL
jgi:predicted nucleic acid-binding protein